MGVPALVRKAAEYSHVLPGAEEAASPSAGPRPRRLRKWPVGWCAHGLRTTGADCVSADLDMKGEKVGMGGGNGDREAHGHNFREVGVAVV